MTVGGGGGKEKPHPKTESAASSETSGGDDVKGTLAKISDAISQNETVSKVKRWMGL